MNLKKIIVLLAIFNSSIQTGFCKEQPTLPDQVIDSISIEGNKYVKNEAILNRIPYRPGQNFDQSISNIAIKNLYDLGSFRQVKLDAEELENNRVKLYVVVEEKKLLEALEFNGNYALRTKQIKEKLNLAKLTTIDEETIRGIALGLKKLYRDENRHNINVGYEIVPSTVNPNKASGVFTIEEGSKSLVKYVHFIGNKQMPDRKLQGIIFTRENWLFSFMDSAGSYNEEMLEMDKHRIEYFYRDHGYLTAKTAKATVEFSENNRDISVTFTVKEGKQFFVRDLRVVGDEIYGEEELLPLVQLETGTPFSQTKLVGSMNRIKDLYGEKGYIYCDVYPQVKPDEDSDKVDITFHIERGNKLYANRITISGNSVTRDKVIRRQLEIAEGDLITTRKLNASQNSVEYLSYFERDSVKWKMHRLTDELADLEMNVQEAKTGNFNFQLTYGTDQYNPIPALQAMLSVQKGNLFGKGQNIGGLIQGQPHRFKFRKVEIHFADPHIFDSDVSAGFNFYKRWDDYDQWTAVNVTPRQRVTGGNIQLGFWLPEIDKRLLLMLELGVEDIRNNNPHAVGPMAAIFEPIVKRTFREGTLSWLSVDLVKDTRDHQVYPRSGYKLCISAKTTLPAVNKQFSFFKGDVEASYYTALIDKFIMGDSLVLALHGKMGNVQSYSGGSRPIPYKELYHIGGQSTVRGFTWGGIGPAWVNGDPLGGRSAMYWNVELVFPLIPDYSMKAHVFYDAGAGFDTPKEGISNPNLIRRDSFDLRHSVGFGLNLVKPVPAKIDWGFKLDRKKAQHESPHEFHLSMNHAW